MLAPYAIHQDSKWMDSKMAVNGDKQKKSTRMMEAMKKRGLQRVIGWIGKLGN